MSIPRSTWCHRRNNRHEQCLAHNPRSSLRCSCPCHAGDPSENSISTALQDGGVALVSTWCDGGWHEPCTGHHELLRLRCQCPCHHDEGPPPR